MSEKRCLGCMLTYEETTDGRCPYCGYAEGTPAKEAYHIKPGSLLNDRYVIGRSIGYGGFGVTYIAWDNKLERRVAIKEYMPSDYATRIPGNLTVTIYDGERHNEFMTGLQKFMEEAQRLSKFQNTPGIVRILDTFARNLTAYIVMEYLDGVTLKEYLKENGGKMPYDKALEVMLPVLAALNAVHQEGIIHRDISPDNIFLTKEGEVKLLDFGAARYASNGYSKSLSVILKPGYAPEEQYYSHGQQGPWSDVYAAAATLYRMITGVVPEESLERKEKDNLKPPSALGAKLPKNAEKAILNALNIKAENRTQSAAEFESQLLATTTVVRIAEKKERRFSTRTPLWLKLVLGGAGAVAAAGVALFAMGVLRFGSGGLTFDFDAIQGNSVNTPGVINLTETEGADAARQAGLVFYITGSYESDTAKQGIIMAQSPAPGEKTTKGSELGVSISTGPSYALVPDIVDTRWEESEGKVTSAGFKPKVFYEYSDLVPKNAVIELGHEAGSKFQVGEKLKVVVSKGSENGFENKTVRMPDISGMTFDDAKKALNKVGLRVLRTNDQYSMTAPKGSIISLNTNAGQTLKVGDVVQITISMGVERVSVPNVIYMTQGSAIAALQNSKLQYRVVEEESDTVAEGLVISQSIKAGETTDVQTVITITVSIGKYTMVPSVVGSSRENAIKQLESSELRYTITEESNAGVAENTVISQSVSAGKRVKVRTEVSIVISLGNLTEVPSVVGMTRSEAVQALRDSKLNCTVKEAESDTVAEGLVASQSVKAGKKIKAESDVTITVSLGKRAALPNVVGQSSSKALSTLSGRGFTNVTVTEKYHESVAAGVVISQSVTTSDRIRVDTPIDLVVSKGQPQWSEWSTSKPSGDYQVESKTQYRSRTIPVESDWSDWKSSREYGNSIVQEDVQRRTRTREQLTTTSENSTLSGWTLSYYETVGSYGDWSTSIPSSGHYETGYRYYMYYCPKDWNSNDYHPYFYGGRSPSDVKSYINANWPNAQVHIYYMEDVSDYDRGQYWYDYVKCTKCSDTFYLYYDCKVYREVPYTLYHYYKYGDWGAWSEWENYSSNAESRVKVEDIDIEYRYRYKYTQGSTGAWSDWQDSYLSAGTGIEVESRTVYRWKEKIR